MPTIATFFGIVVTMYRREHPPPHVHASYQGFEALIDIQTGGIIGGHIPPAAARIMKEWVEYRHKELLENWERGRMRRPFLKVPGADVE